MKKLRPFRLIADWFSTVRGTVLAALFLTAVFSGLHLLGAGTLYEMRYALLLAIVGLVAAGVRSFLRYVQRAVSLYAAQQRPPVEEASLPEARTAPERDFRALADLYRRDRDAAAERAAQAERDRLDYFTLWVHQIKTPIAALDLMAQSDEPIDREVMRQETFKISQYADSALTFQRLQSLPNDLALSEVPLYPLCCKVVKKLRPLFQYRKIALSMEPFEGVALSDPKWLGMAITQVLTNSLKYTPEGGRITVFLREPLMLAISDTGAGIPAEDLPRVFERGFTGQAGRRGCEGEKSTGIGLYLCKQACDKLKHKVSIASAPGKGTTVTFDLRRESYEEYA